MTNTSPSPADTPRWSVSFDSRDGVVDLRYRPPRNGARPMEAADACPPNGRPGPALIPEAGHSRRRSRTGRTTFATGPHPHDRKPAHGRGPSTADDRPRVNKVSRAGPSNTGPDRLWSTKGRCAAGPFTGIHVTPVGQRDGADRHPPVLPAPRALGPSRPSGPGDQFRV